MSNTTTKGKTESGVASTSIDAAADRLASAIEQDDSEGGLSKVAVEVWDVVEEAGNLLETVDLDSLPDAIDLEELPEAVDTERLLSAARERDPALALDLHAIRHAVRLQSLWNSVDLVAFAGAKARLEKELADVVGEDAMQGDGDSETAADVREIAAEIGSATKNAAIQQQAEKGFSEGRNALIAGHTAFEDVYETNQRHPDYVGRRPVSRNPTAVSLLPVGPLPTSASTRFSSVPSNVRQAQADALARIYGDRWRTVGPGS